MKLNRRRFLLGSAALGIGALPVVKATPIMFESEITQLATQISMGRRYAAALAESFVQTKQVVAGRVLDQAFRAVVDAAPAGSRLATFRTTRRLLLDNTYLTSSPQGLRRG